MQTVFEKSCLSFLVEKVGNQSQPRGHVPCLRLLLPWNKNTICYGKKMETHYQMLMLVVLIYVFYFQKKPKHPTIRNLWEMLHTKGFWRLLMPCSLFMSLGFVFEFSGGKHHFSCWNHCFQHRGVPVLLSVRTYRHSHCQCSQWIALSRERPFDVPAHLEEICTVQENLRLTYDKPQESAIPVILFSSDSYLTERGFSWVCNMRIFFFFFCCIVPLTIRYVFQDGGWELQASHTALWTTSHSSELSSWENIFARRSGPAEIRWLLLNLLSKGY